jgi:cytochrome c peroxidase
MPNARSLSVITASLILPGILALNGTGGPAPGQQSSPDPTGILTSYSTSGPFSAAHPFFQALGTNGRACVTCHEPTAAWSLTPAFVQARFNATGGLDPLFRPHDGATSPGADVSSTEARRQAYRLLLSRGLIRMGLPLPPAAEFALEAVDDPYGYASATELSLFRRPLPAANMRFASSIMWDGRESPDGLPVAEALARQAANATLLHAQALRAPTTSQLRQIVEFELGLFTAQGTDRKAGRLDARSGRGGARNLARQQFYLGINDPFGEDPTGAAFDPVTFRLFRAWRRLEGSRSSSDQARAAVARGENLFNTHPFTVSGVPGFNDIAGQPVITGTCSSCHNTPNEGGSSLPRFMDLGISSGFRRTPDMPLYTLRDHRTGEVTSTMDPGRALVTGRWADIGKFKVPSMRGLTARAPYFHDGSAPTLHDVVEFYRGRFGLVLSTQERADLVAFLQSL